jgi:hypothetical protein
MCDLNVHGDSSGSCTIDFVLIHATIMREREMSYELMILLYASNIYLSDEKILLR